MDAPALPPYLEVVTEDELAAVLAGAIRDGRAGTMTREAELFLAGVSAVFLVDRLALAGLVVVRRLDGYSATKSYLPTP
jgi:hypothetical protein